MSRVLLGAVLAVLASASCATPPLQQREARPAPTIPLAPCRLPKSSDDVLCGRYDVFENRAAQAGHRIALNIVVLPALGPKTAPDPSSSSWVGRASAPPAR